MLINRAVCFAIVLELSADPVARKRPGERLVSQSFPAAIANVAAFGDLGYSLPAQQQAFVN